MAQAHNGMFSLLSRMVLEDHPACPGCGYVPQAKATYISLPSSTLASYAKAVSKHVASDGTTLAFPPPQNFILESESGNMACRHTPQRNAK